MADKLLSLTYFLIIFKFSIVNGKSELFKETKNLSSNLQLILSMPRHVHISYGNEPSEMFITWSTIEDPNGTWVEFGQKLINENRLNGTMTYFSPNKNGENSQFIHRVLLKGLKSGQKYFYHCGSDVGGWSDIYSFIAMRTDENYSPTLVMFGDMGNENAQSLPRLQEEAALGMFDAIIHNGDFAYDMDWEKGRVGDAFMEQIQPIAASFPYMTCPGNHEQRGNFTHYKNRFTMPGEFNSMMYSWNMGPIHFISFSTEAYYYLKYGLKPVVTQYEWLKKDLEEANKPQNRAKRPWIITYGHRPMYCSNNYTDDCTNHNSLVRVGIPVLHMLGLEDLFMENKVDMSVWAHQHSYERMWPLYNYTVVNGTNEDPYKYPRAPVHITTGSAGCRERHSDVTKVQPPFVAYRAMDYGYTRVKAQNKTHLYIEQISDDQNGKVIDSFTIIKEVIGEDFKSEL